MRKIKGLLTGLFLFFSLIMFSQESLKNGYKQFQLGMSQSDVKRVLKESPDFVQKKEEVLTIRIEPDTQILSTEGLGFILLGYFHFNNDQLYQILLKIDESKIGYYYLLKSLTKKYGQPTDFSPERVIWEDGTVRLVLEKPCTLKYVSIPLWNALISKDETDDTMVEKVRKNFTDEL